MERIEKHVLHKLINNEVVEITPDQLKYFSLEFHKQYNLLSRMATQNLPISKEDLEIYALYEGQEIDINYESYEESFADKNIEDFIKLNIKKRENNMQNDKMALLFESFRNGDKLSGIELNKMLSASIAGNSKGAVVPIKDYYNEQATFFRNMINGVELDGLLFWGNNKKNTRQFMGLSYILKRIAPTDLVVIGARPSVGKTSFALALMNALYKNDYKPMFVSLEMTNGELLQRLATAKSGLSHDLMMSTETKLTSEQIAQYESGLLEASQMDIKLINNPPTSWLDLKQLFIKHVDEVDYFVIDHLHIISTYDGIPNNNKNNMYADITREMKMFARDYKKPIIVLAQLSREVRGAGRQEDPSYVEPNMTDLRDSGSIEQDADKIIMLYRESPNGTKEAKQTAYENHKRYGVFPIICKIDKHRAGSLGQVKMTFNAKNGRWAEKYKERNDKNE